jgi:photosystem II reaction center protein PsbP
MIHKVHSFLIDKKPSHVLPYLYTRRDSFSVMLRIDIISVTSAIALLFITVSLVLPGSITQSSSAEHQYTPANRTTSGKISTNFQTYSNLAFGIKMKYPSNWLKLDLSRNNSSVLVVAFKTPVGSPLGSLNILGGNVSSGNVTLTALVNTTINHLRQTGKILHLISSTPTTLAGNLAHKLVYTTMAPQGFELEAMQLISLIGKKAYFITYAVPTANYATYLPIILRMISSTVIIK